MDNRVLWAVKLWGRMKDQATTGCGVGLVEDSFTIHVVTDKGYQAAVEAAVKDAERSWEVVVKGVEEIGSAPLFV